MRNLQSRLQYRILKEEALIRYGFKKIGESYQYQIPIEDSLQLVITISKDQKTSAIIDSQTKEEYILVDLERETGSFVAKMKETYDQLIEAFIQNCTIENNQVADLIAYIENKYHDQLEYLWKNDTKNAVWRAKTNKKWYGVLMEIEENRLGLPSDQIIQVVDLKCHPEDLKELVDYQTIFPGYHMNKKYWITIILNRNVLNETIFSLIDQSYMLTQNKQKQRGENMRIQKNK